MNKNEEVTDEQLRAWFLSQGYEPDNISTNVLDAGQWKYMRVGAVQKSGVYTSNTCNNR